MVGMAPEEEGGKDGQQNNQTEGGGVDKRGVLPFLISISLILDATYIFCCFSGDKTDNGSGTERDGQGG